MSAPLPGSAAATSPDLRKRPLPLPAATWPHRLTSAVAGSGRSGPWPESAVQGLSGLVLAATATRPHLSVFGVVVVLVVLAVVWVIRLWLWPYGRCARCDGSGKNTGSNGRRWGTCRKCRGTGRRQRFGSRLVARVLGRKRG